MFNYCLRRPRLSPKTQSLDFECARSFARHVQREKNALCLQAGASKNLYTRFLDAPGKEWQEVFSCKEPQVPQPRTRGFIQFHWNFIIFKYRFKPLELKLYLHTVIPSSSYTIQALV
jgi:hypothetical protein